MTKYFYTDPDDEEVLEEREKSSIPFLKSPFHLEGLNLPTPRNRPGHPTRSATETTLTLRELPVHLAENVEWLDLLLELAMTTAFANLADNTSITTAKDAASYVAFFLLVWWIWASQVAYNMRFRQGDWFHRLCAFLQLVVFSGMAAFTNNFDITEGLFPQSSDDQQIANITLQLTGSTADLAAQGIRNARLPILNARGISIVMACSRLLMVAQYLVVWYHARIFRRQSIMVHILSTFVSALFYFGAYALLTKSSDPSRVDQIGKLGLWYLPIFIEIIAHFVANWLPGRVMYSVKSVFARSSTLFIVVLGIGLDKITNQFQFVVGTIGFGAASVGVSFSIAIILFGFFFIYFGSGEKIKSGNNRSLIYFLFHMPFMAAMIITLRGIASLFSFVNFTNAINALQDSFNTILDAVGGVIQTGQPLSVSQFPNVDQLYDKVGISLETLLGTINSATVNARAILDALDANDALTDEKANAVVVGFFAQVLQALLSVELSIVKEFNAMPDETSLLSFQILQFQNTNFLNNATFLSNATVTNPSGLDPNTFFDIQNAFVTNRLTPSLWFAGTAGFTLFMLGIFILLRRWPRDIYDWALVAIRVVFGLGYASLSVFDIHFERPIDFSRIDLTTGDTIDIESDSIVWKFAQSGWMLPSLALLLVVVNALSLLVAYLARRALLKQGYVPKRSQSTMSDQQTPPPTVPATARSSAPFWPKAEPPMPLHSEPLSYFPAPFTGPFSSDLPSGARHPYVQAYGPRT